MSSVEASLPIHSMLRRLIRDGYTRSDYALYSEPTVFENYVNEVQVDDQVIELSLWDTA